MATTIQTPRPKTSSPPPQLPQHPRRGQFASRLQLHTLKGQFILLAGLLALLAGILTLVGSISLNRSANDLNTINSGSIPSVDAALNITQSIEVIDAQSADFLGAAGLTSQTSCSPAGINTTEIQKAAIPQSSTDHDCDDHNIDAEIVLVNETLFEAAHNVTFPGEQTAVERITIGLERYLGYIDQMRANYNLAQANGHKTDPNDLNLQKAYQAYMNASAILHGQISLATLGTNKIPLSPETNLPSCTLPDKNQTTLTPAQWTQGGLTDALDCLSYINYSHLQGAYNDSASFLTAMTWLLAILCTLFCALLLFGVVRMITTSRRLLNPGLLPALLIALILSFNVVSLLANLGAQSGAAIQHGAFKQLVIDDYQSVYDAALLTRYGTDANADESRWLIAQEFNDQPNIQHWQDDWNNNVQQITTLMQNAHANQTWQEEIRPLADMDTNWNQYYKLDGQIRSTATDQNLSASQRLFNAEVISTGKSNQAFSNFTDAVARLSQANRDHYTQTFNYANSSLMLSFVLCLVLFPLAGFLVVWGIAIRLRDF